MAEGMSVCLPSDILLCIFDFLSVPDLEACLEVCEEWKEVVYTTLKKRRCIEAFLLDPPPAKRKALWQNGKVGMKKKRKMLKSKTETPSVLSDALLTLVCNNQKRVNISKKIVMTKELIKIHASSRLYKQDGPSKSHLTGLRFPPHEKVIIKTIELGYDPQMTFNGLEEEIGIPKDVPIKAVLLFCSKKFRRCENVLNNISKVSQWVKIKQCAMTGSWVKLDSSNACAISMTVFAGENIEAGSCILDYSMMYGDVDGKFEDFSKRVGDFDNSILMIFSPEDTDRCGKGFTDISIRGIAAMWKYFPSRPKLAYNVTGPFGLDYPTNVPKSKLQLVTDASAGLFYIAYKK